MSPNDDGGRVAEQGSECIASAIDQYPGSGRALQIANPDVVAKVGRRGAAVRFLPLPVFEAVVPGVTGTDAAAIPT